MLNIKRPGKSLLSNLKITFVFWLVFMLVSAAFVLLTNHGDLNIFFSSHFSENLSLFFKYYTLLGEEWLLVPICLLIFFIIKQADFAVKVILTFIINAIITYFSKHFVFNSERPSKFLEHYNLAFTEGVNVHQYNSFPSGHTSTAFALAFILSFYFKSDYKGVILVFLAIMVGISRIYLQQHFPEDVIGGAFIGLISALIANSVSIISKK